MMPNFALGARRRRCGRRCDQRLAHNRAISEGDSGGRHFMQGDAGVSWCAAPPATPQRRADTAVVYMPRILAAVRRDTLRRWLQCIIGLPYSIPCR